MAPADDNKVRSRIIFVLTNLISLLFLVWALHGLSWGRLRHDVAHLEWHWVALGALLDVLTYVIQGWRWSLVLAPVKRVPVATSSINIFVGLFANEVLPLRAGELIRCFLQSSEAEIPVSVTLASALIERLFDGFWLILAVLVTIRYVHLPHQLVFGAVMLCIVLLITGALVGIAMFWKQPALDRFLGAKWLSWVHTLIEDLHLIGHSRYLYYSWFASLPFFLIQVAMTYAFMRAYQPLGALHMGAAFTLAVMLRLSSAVPQAPGNLGLSNFVTRMGLMAFGVAAQPAQRFSLILWTAMTAPLLIAGFIAMAITGGTLGDLHKEARAGVRRREEWEDESVAPDRK